jgi:hypothetical protein
VIVKFLLKNLGRRKTYRSAEFFKNEAIFYEKVIGSLKLKHLKNGNFRFGHQCKNSKSQRESRTNLITFHSIHICSITPRISQVLFFRLLACYIDGSNDFVALQDVSPEGYKGADRGPGLDYVTTVAILKVLAGFHAVSLAFKDQQPENFEKAATALEVNKTFVVYRC